MGRSGARWSRGCPIVGPTTQAVALELDAVGIVNDAVQYGADSDDLARVYRFDLAQDSEMISPTIPI
ncbi:hypothetical protein ACNJX9_34245 [Bradyrhizobium sp. DASA03076]